MKSIASVLSIIALGFGLLGCPGSGGGGGVTFAITTTAAPFGVVGNAYSSTLATTGGTAPLTWILFGGVLPNGLSLNGATGVVSGTPTAAGNSTVTFTVTDSTGKTATGSVLFAVHPRTDRVSVDSSGAAGTGASSAPSINGDGSLVAFVSQSTNFVATVGGTQIYVHNRQTNQIELVSRDNSASVVTEGNGVSSAPSISAEGRFVGFVSLATNLLAPGPAVPAGQQIYVRDRQTGLTSLVSVDNNVTTNPGNGVSSAPTMSADGRFVAFVSLATNLLAPGPAVPAGQQIYVRDRQTGLTSLVSVDNNVAPNPGTGLSSAPSISADGRFVAFVSVATDLLAPGAAVPAGQQIYVRDRQTGLTSLVSVDNTGLSTPGNGDSSAPSISADGRFVAFVSLATTLLAPGPAVPAGQQIYVRDRQLGQSSLASQDNTNTNVAGTGGGGVSDTPSTNSNGGFVAFFSQATNLVTAPPAAPSDIYVRAMP